MGKFSLRIFFVLITLLILCTFIISIMGCDEKKKKTLMKADIEITIVNKNNLIIADTDVSILGISDKDITYIYTTDTNGTITIKNLSERTLTFVIHTEQISYSTEHVITKKDLEQGKLIVKFSDYQ